MTVSFKIHAVIKSGPAALWIFKLASRLDIPSVVIFKSSIARYGLGPLSGKLLRWSIVKTELNWALKASALTGASVRRSPFCIKEGINILSFLMALI